MQKKTSLGFSTAIDLDLGPTVDRGDTHRSLASASCVEENSFGSVYWGVYSRCVYVHIYMNYIASNYVKQTRYRNLKDQTQWKKSKKLDIRHRTGKRLYHDVYLLVFAHYMVSTLLSKHDLKAI